MPARDVKWFNQIYVPRICHTVGIVATIPDVPPVVQLYAGEEYCGIEVYEMDTYSAQDVKRLKAKRFVELIMSGKTPTKAAKEINEQLSRYQTKEEVQLAIVKTLEKWHIPAQARKEYSRAKLVEILTEQDVTDPKAAKVALEAIKLIGSDEEVGYLNPKVQAPPVGSAQLPEALQKLLGVGEKEAEDVVDVTEEAEDDGD